jgi:hypothetical protein
MNRWFLGIVFCLFWGVSTAEGAGISGLDRWQFNGFGTVSAVYNDDRDADYVRNIAQIDQETRPWALSQDSVLGGQVSYHSDNRRFNATLQAVSKYRYDGSYTPDISLAFLNYHLSDKLQIRVGRLSPDILHRSDSRDVGYSYLWARPPVEFYGVINVSRFDGFDAQWKQFSDLGFFKAKVFWGLSHEKVSGEGGGTFDYDDSTFIGVIGEYEKDNLSLRASAIELGLKAQINSVTVLHDSLDQLGAQYNLPHLSHLADEFLMDGKYLHYYDLGAAWESGGWVLQTGGTFIESNSLTIPDLTAYFVSMGYRVGKWTPYTVLSEVKSKEHNRTTGLGDAIDAAVISPVLDSSQVDQMSISLGTRYELSQSVAIKVQYDHLKSKVKEGLLLYVNDAESWDRDLDVFTIGLDFIF